LASNGLHGNFSSVEKPAAENVCITKDVGFTGGGGEKDNAEVFAETSVHLSPP